MHQGKTSSSDSKEYPSDSLMGRLKERKIIATLVAFADITEPWFKKLIDE